MPHVTLSDADRARIDRTRAALDEAKRRVSEFSAEILDEPQREAHEAILIAHRNGASSADLAAHLGVHRSRAHQMIQEARRALSSE